MIRKDSNSIKQGNLTVPGKIFLIGEYQVLVGRPAVILAIPPYFSLTLDENSAVSTDLGGPENKRIPFSPPSASPAGKVLESIPVENISNLVMNWSDPFFGAGGFGGSTAEFAFASYIAGDRTAEESLERYLFIHENGTLPSGADLFTQWYGGAVLFQARRRVKDLTENCEGLSCLIFSASHLPGRKVVTHSHLEKLNLPGLDGLGPSVENAIAALEKKDLVSLGETFTHFARVLNGLGFESEAAKADRLAFAEIDGVFGVKGCGALLSDAVLVVYGTSLAKAAALKLASERGLKLVQEKITLGHGLEFRAGQVTHE